MEELTRFTEDEEGARGQVFEFLYVAEGLLKKRMPSVGAEKHPRGRRPR